MINLFFLINRQGKIRLTKFFETFNLHERNKLLREVHHNITIFIIKLLYSNI